MFGSTLEQALPRWLLVKEGRFGGRSTLVPFSDPTAGAGHVWVPYERDVVREAPQIEPGVPLPSRSRRRFATTTPRMPRRPYRMDRSRPAEAIRKGFRCSTAHPGDRPARAAAADRRAASASASPAAAAAGPAPSPQAPRYEFPPAPAPRPTPSAYPPAPPQEPVYQVASRPLRPRPSIRMQLWPPRSSREASSRSNSRETLRSRASCARSGSRRAAATPGL